LPELNTYISNLLKKGYSVAQIKSTLLEYGYPEQAIDQAIYNLKGHEVQHTIHITKTSLIAVVIIVLGLITSSYFIFNKEGQAETLLDVKVERIDSEVKPGELLSASIELSNMGSDERYDIHLKYEIFDEGTNERLTFKSETVALETAKSQNMNIEIPNNAPEGSYIFQVTARYSGEAPIATSMFRIKEDAQQTATCYDSIKNQGEEDIDCGGPCPACKECPASCDDDDAATEDYCSAATGFECRNDRSDVCGDGTCSLSEGSATCPEDCSTDPPLINVWNELDRIKELAQSDCTGAKEECEKIGSDFRDKCLQNVGEICLDANTCDKIEDQMQKEKCFYNVAKGLNKKVLCENIQSEDRRNSCYIHFAVNGDYEVCDKITNEYVKKSCNTLKQAAQ